MKEMDESLVRALFRKVEHVVHVVEEMQGLQQEGFYSVQQFARLTGLDEDTITLYCRQEQLGAVKIKGTWMILKSEGLRLIKEAMDNNRNKLRRTGKRDAAILNHLGIAK